MSADTADKILSSNWLVSLKLSSDWLDEPFKRRISKVAQTNNTKHIDLIVVEVLTFAIKKLKII